MDTYYQHLTLSNTASSTEIKQAIQTQIQQVKKAYQTLSNPNHRQNNQTATYYAVLGIATDATDNQIKTAGQTKLDELKTIYHVLLDSQQRADYDASLLAPVDKIEANENDWGQTEPSSDLPAEAHVASHDYDNNPYETPKSEVSTENGQAAPFKLFSFRRMGRIRYIAYSFGIATLLPLFIIMGTLDSGLNKPFEGAIFIIAIFWFFSFVVNLILSIQRLHDFDFSGWWILTFLLGIPTFIFFFIFIFKSGTQGENNYGFPCVPNTLTEKIVAGFFILLFFVGILAAIALPNSIF